MRVTTLLAATALLANPAAGQIHWTTTQVESPVNSGLGEVTAEFPFVNAGKTAVTFEPPTASCGCTSVSLDPMIYGPGESGVVKASYKAGGRRTRQLFITVRSNDPDRSIVKLSLINRVPELLQVKNPTLTWNHDDRPTARNTMLTAEGDTPVLIVGVKSSSPGFEASIETVEAGRSYRLVVSQVGTAKPGSRANIEIEAVSVTLATTQTIRVHALVERRPRRNGRETASPERPRGSIRAGKRAGVTKHGGVAEPTGRRDQ
jgi:hypothetical protein